MQSGIVFGYAGLVDGLVGRLRRELGFPCRVIATGGLARLIAPQTETIEDVDDDLTLTGLRLIYERNAERNSGPATAARGARRRPGLTSPVSRPRPRGASAPSSRRRRRPAGASARALVRRRGARGARARSSLAIVLGAEPVSIARASPSRRASTGPSSSTCACRASLLAAVAGAGLRPWGPRSRRCSGTRSPSRSCWASPAAPRSAPRSRSRSASARRPSSAPRSCPLRRSRRPRRDAARLRHRARRGRGLLRRLDAPRRRHRERDRGGRSSPSSRRSSPSRAQQLPPVARRLRRARRTTLGPPRRRRVRRPQAAAGAPRRRRAAEPPRARRRRRRDPGRRRARRRAPGLPRVLVRRRRDRQPHRPHRVRRAHRPARAPPSSSARITGGCLPLSLVAGAVVLTRATSSRGSRSGGSARSRPWAR